jgi:hypothetical protein
MAASCAHFWDFFVALLFVGENNLGVFLSVLPTAGEKNFEGVCFVSKSCQLFTFLEFNFFQKNERKKNNQ